MSGNRHHPVHEMLVRTAVENLCSEFPQADPDEIRDLVSEAFVRIVDRCDARLVALLAEHQVRNVLDREAQLVALA